MVVLESAPADLKRHFKTISVLEELIMKYFAVCLALVLGILFFAGCNGKPDLIVTGISLNGSAIINSQGSVELPIKVTVKNQGSGSAGIFKISVEYTSPQGTYVVAFSVPGQSNIWYPYTTASLAGGASISFAGKLIFHPAVRGVSVTLRATADSCSGDEFMPDYCRVDESNETNNISAPLSTVLP